MKIGTITIHYGFNFGSALQAYALVKYLNTRVDNVEAKLINYIPPRYSISRRYFKTSKYSNLMKKWAYLLLVAPYKMRNQWIFDRFLNTYISMTKQVNSFSDACEVAREFDVFITGSDQVWNSDYNEGVDPMYYLGFAPETSKKLSYAASCGKDDYSENEWKEIDRLLDNFTGISLREKNSKQLFIDRGYNNAQQSLDPIFLLDKTEWKMIEKRPSRIIDKYVLVYCLDSDEKDLIRIANEVAKARGLKTAIISYSHFWNRYDVDYVYRNQSPNNFLWLISHASYIVTNSFHGVAFSINLEKQFVAVKRRKYNSRLDSILEITGMMDRYIAFDCHFDDRKDIDYEVINQRKKQLVDESESYLQSILKGLKNETCDKD